MLDDLADDGTMYVEGDSAEWSPGSDTAVGIEDVESEVERLPPKAEGRSYFLEVAIAREVLDAWAGNLDHEPTLDEKVARVIHYARYDA